MTSYTINGKYVGINIGTFIAIGNTVSFTNGVKDGWVLCDGSTRQNTNGMFTNLYNMGIGSIVSTDYISPNLNGRIMMGPTCAGSNFTLNTNQGQTDNQVTLSVSNLPSHNHTISLTDSSHTHSYSDATPTYLNTDNNQSQFGDNSTGYLGKNDSTTGPASDAHTHTVTIGSIYDSVGSGLGNSISIKNSAFHIQWIVKYA